MFSRHLLLLPSAIVLQVAFSTPAVALTAADAYREAASRVLPVMISDAGGKELSRQTAAVIAKGQAITVCDNMLASDQLKLLVGERSVPATLLKRDRRKNLCLLSAPDLTVAPLETARSEPAVGAKVFAISNALGLGIGVTEGIVSALRSYSHGDFIQFSAAVAPGSQGGALLDGDGRLLGVIDYRQRDGQNVNFARPSADLSRLVDAGESDLAAQRFNEEATRLLRASDWKKLSQLAEERAKASPQEVEPWTFLATASQQLKDTGTEEKCYQALRSLQPDALWPAVALAQLWLRQGKQADALKLARSLLSIRSEDANVWATIGLAEAANGAFDRSGEAFSKALSIDPWQPYAHAGLIGLADQRKDWAAAAAMLGRLADVSPGDTWTRYRLFHYLLLSGKAEKAYRILVQLPPEEQQRPVELYWRGRILLAMWRLVGATEAFRQSIDKGLEKPAEAWGGLGVAYNELNRFPEAIAAFREAAKLAPDNIEWERSLVVALKDGGHPAEAVAISQARTIKDPKDATAWRHLGLSLGMNDQAAKSVEALQKSLELDPRQGKVWASLAEQYGILGKQDDVRRTYQKLRDVDNRWAEEVYKAFILPFDGGAK